MKNVVRPIIIATSLLAAFALAGATAQAGDITYEVNQVIGAGGVTGTITTDGTLGQLNASEITAWSLHLTGNGGATWTLVNGSSGVEVGNISSPFDPNLGTPDLTADAQHIYFNYDATDGGYLGFQTNPIYGGQNYWCNASNGNGFDCAQGKSVVPVLYSDLSSIYEGATGNQIIATARTSSTVPEPSTLLLFGGGIAGLAFRKRFMGTRS